MVLVTHSLFEIWHLVQYGGPVVNGSKIVWVGNSSVTIETPELLGVPTGINLWSEKHRYKNDNGDHLEQQMTAFQGPTLPPQTAHYKISKSSSDAWFEKGNNLEGIGKIASLIFEDPAGPVFWVPLPGPLGNTEVDKKLD